MPFIGERRVNWVLEQYDLYRRESRRGNILVVSSVAVVVVVEAVNTYLPLDIRYFIAGILGIAALGMLFFGARRFNKDLQFYLPEIEDRLLCFLKPAVESLAAYVEHNKPHDERKATKNLEGVADLLEKWYPGNLRFVKEGQIGTMLKDIQTNFRNGLLPRVRDAKKGADLRDILKIVEIMERVLEQTTAIGEEHLVSWSGMLSQHPAVALPTPFWRRIPTKKSQILKGLVTAVVTAIAGAIGFSINAATGYLGTISMFGIMVLILVSTRERRKEE